MQVVKRQTRNIQHGLGCMNTLFGFLRGVVAVVIATLNTSFWLVLFFPVALVKLLPIRRTQHFCTHILNGIGVYWAGSNCFFMDALRLTHWNITGNQGFSPKNWYLVLANHQSWTDIMVLLYAFNGRVPFFRFFLKKQLLWFPFMGLVWWALDYPFMHRYSKKVLAKKPELKGKDLEETKKVCKKYKQLPVTIMNFVEGTRFAPKKRVAQASPYTYLLKPRAGGLAFVLASMGEQFTSILDVAIAYKSQKKGFWTFLCGQIPEIKVHIETLSPDHHLSGDYFGDPAFRIFFQQWINGLWKQKDTLLGTMLSASSEFQDNKL